MVIQFPSKKDTTLFLGQVVKTPKTKSDFLSMIKRFLTQKDYMDICTGILDYSHYEVMQSHFKIVVDAYHRYER